MATILHKQGSAVAVSHDMMMVRYDGKGVLFKKELLTRGYKHDDIVQFNARKATTVDIEVGDKLSQMANYELAWVGTELKFIKQGRMLVAEGAVINIPDDKAQYMFVDWKYTKNPPTLAKIPGYTKPLTTNVFVTRATVRPDVEKLTEMFKPGQRVKFVAREQAPNERGVCWRAALATDEYHDIAIDVPNAHGRQTYRVIPKAGVCPPAPLQQRPLAPPNPQVPSTSAWNIAPTPTPVTVQRPLRKPVTPQPVKSAFQAQKPPPIDGFDYFDSSKEACAARFRNFANTYRKNNPNCIFSQPCFEGALKIKYLNQIHEELTVMREGEVDV